MTIKKIAIGLALVLAGSSAALAASIDGDGNPVPGSQYEMQGAFANAFASMRMPVAPVREYVVRKGERDGDGNLIPGQR